MAARRTILVVDDEPMVRQIYRRVLTDAGYEVVEASSGPDALSILAADTGSVAMVITDWQLAEETSEALITYILALRPPLPVVCVSGSIGDGVLPVRVLAKPIDRTTLLAVVAQELSLAGG